VSTRKKRKKMIRCNTKKKAAALHIRVGVLDANIISRDLLSQLVMGVEHRDKEASLQLSRGDK
jgi:hypothetical protein